MKGAEEKKVNQLTELIKVNCSQFPIFSCFGVSKSPGIEGVEGVEGVQG